MGNRQRLAVHLPDQTYLRVHGVFESMALQVVVGRVKDDVGCFGLNLSQVQHRTKRCSAPAGIADQLVSPSAGAECVANTHQRVHGLLAGERTHFVQRQRELVVDQPADLEPPRVAIDGGVEEILGHGVEVGVGCYGVRQATSDHTTNTGAGGVPHVVAEIDGGNDADAEGAGADEKAAAGEC